MLRQGHKRRNRLAERMRRNRRAGHRQGHRRAGHEPTRHRLAHQASTAFQACLKKSELHLKTTSVCVRVRVWAATCGTSVPQTKKHCCCWQDTVAPGTHQSTCSSRQATLHRHYTFTHTHPTIYSTITHTHCNLDCQMLRAHVRTHCKLKCWVLHTHTMQA